MRMRASVGSVSAVACSVLLLLGCQGLEGSADPPVSQDEHALATVDGAIDGFIEIDDLDGLGPGMQDANLCSDGVVSLPTCPSAGTQADNPNFPGPDPDRPDVLGTSGYLDWADLPSDSSYFPVDLGAFDAAQEDDVFLHGSCVVSGRSPSRGDIRFIGLAANLEYLYLLTERRTTHGEEARHVLFTQNLPRLDAVGGCRDPTWVWDPIDGDVQVAVRFQSTAGLPDASVVVTSWEDADGNPDDDVGTPAEDLLRSSSWVAPPAALFPPPTRPAYAALNVAPGPRSPDADTEYDLDGVACDSGQLVETAVAREKILGAGCGFTRYVTVISTAGGQRPADLLGPVEWQASCP